MTITAATSAASPNFLSAADGAPAASRIPKRVLDQEDFVKLLAVQFQSQDPLKPMEDTSFIAQMAQFTSLQQTNTMVDTITQLRADQQRLAAAAYIGKHVTLDAGEDGTVAGQVTAVDNTGSAPQLVVNGRNYDLTALLRIEAAAPVSQTPAASHSAP